MDKKNVMGSLSSTRKRKPSKKLVDDIRKEAFQNAYPDQQTDKQKSAQKEDTTTEEKQEAKEEPMTLVGEAKVNAQNNEEIGETLKTEDTTPIEEPKESKQSKAETKPVAKKSNRGRKKKINPDGPNEFTTLNCTQPTLNRAKISSALTNTPMYQFVDDAIDHYIRYLKKSGKISLDF